MAVVRVKGFLRKGTFVAGYARRSGPFAGPQQVILARYQGGLGSSRRAMRRASIVLTQKTYGWQAESSYAGGGRTYNKLTRSSLGRIHRLAGRAGVKFPLYV